MDPMEWLWLFYWLAIFLSLVLGIVSFFKCKQTRWLGLLQSALTICFASWAYVFAHHRCFDTQSELGFLLQELKNGSLAAILLVLLFIVLFLLFIRSVVQLKKGFS